MAGLLATAVIVADQAGGAEARIAAESDIGATGVAAPPPADGVDPIPELDGAIDSESDDDSSHAEDALDDAIAEGDDDDREPASTGLSSSPGLADDPTPSEPAGEQAAPERPGAISTPEPTPTPAPTAAPAATPNPTPEPLEQEDFPAGAELPDIGVPVVNPGPVPELPPAGDVNPEPAESAVPPAPEPIPVDLETLPPEGVPPMPEPEPEPPVSVSDVADGAPGNLTGNEVGCESRCITRALLHKNIRTADVDFEMRTNVATTRAIWVLPNGPFVVDGLPVHMRNAPYATDMQPGKSWNLPITGLEHGRSYRIVVTAADNQGNVEMATTVMTTTDGPADDLASPGSPCNFDCLTSATVIPGPDFGRASISIEANAPVLFEVAISTSEPGTIDGNPFLPNDVTITDVTASDVSYQANAIGLAPKTEYYIVVRVTDDEGNRNYATGSFTSLPAPVVPDPEPLPDESVFVATWIERVHIHENGDNVGRGEVSMRYGIFDLGDDTPESEAATDHRWVRPFVKVSDGESMDAYGMRLSEVDPWERLPSVIVNAAESDAVGDPLTDCGFEVAAQLAGSDRISTCDQALTAAVLDDITVGWIETLPSCDGYGVEIAQSSDRCFVLKSGPSPDGFVVFDALIVFRIYP